MSTTFYSSTIDGCRCKCTYSVSSTSTTTTISGTIYLQHKGSANSWLLGIKAGVNLLSSSSKPSLYTATTSEIYNVSSHSDWTTLKTKTFEFVEDRTHSTRTRYLHAGILDFLDVTGNKYDSVSIPAKSSYSIKYYSDASTLYKSDTKYYGETYNIIYTRPTKNGYKFLSWNTNSSGTGTTYYPDAEYKTNAALTLYAVWGAVPSISSITAVRTDEHGVEDPQAGTYALVTCIWAIPSGTATLSGNIIDDDGIIIPFSFSSGHTGSGGTAIALVPGIGTDGQYVVEVTAVNDNVSECRTSVNELLTKAKFVMDFKSGGLGVGIGRAAPASGLEIGYETDFHEDVNFHKDGMFTGDVYSGGTKLAKEDHTHKSHFKVVTYSGHSSKSVGTSGESATYDITEPGYYPLGIVGFYISNANVLVRACYLNNISDGSATINYYMRSVSGTNTVTQTTRVLWVKI